MHQSEKADHRSKTLLFIEIAGDLGSALAKFIVGILGNSSAMIAEGLHSLADTTNQIFLLIGIESSKRPADHSHPFGYGKERFFWAFLSALFIVLFSGGFAVYQGVRKVIDPEPISNIGIAIAILGISLAFQFVNLFFSSKHYRMLAGGKQSIKELFSKAKFIKEPTAINLWLGDLAAVGGNLFAGLALWLVFVTGNPIYDGIASVMIGLGLVFLGLFLAKDTKQLLIGEAVAPAMYEKIINLIRSFDEVNSIVRLKTMHLTPNEILINADIDFKEGLDTFNIDEVVDNIETKIRNEIPAAKQIYLEVERQKNF